MGTQNSVRDVASVSLGVISILSWAVAEIPQIITNYKAKSTAGLSIGFLVTWIIGDLLNLLGCLLEPATLPTQFYTAVLYTMITVVLTGQATYYGYICHPKKKQKFSSHHEAQMFCDEEAAVKEKLLGLSNDDMESKSSVYQEYGYSPRTQGQALPSTPIPVAASVINIHFPSGRDFYYTSARSLSSSPKAITGSLSAHLYNSGRTPPTFHSDGQHVQGPLPGRNPPLSSSPLKTKNTLSVAFSAIFIIATIGFHLSGNKGFDTPQHEMVLRVGRNILQVKNLESSSGKGDASSVGSFLGWAMAFIYMGGRLPQICLNFKRGNVEGLSPLMFIFALLGNGTYVGSILVKSLDWSQISPNLPWLADAGGCILLDCCILLQFLYFHLRKPKDDKNIQADASQGLIVSMRD